MEAKCDSGPAPEASRPSVEGLGRSNCGWKRGDHIASGWQFSTGCMSLMAVHPPHAVSVAGGARPADSKNRICQRETITRYIRS